MLQTSATNPAASRYGGSATAAVLLGAGMACAGAAQAGEQPLPEAPAALETAAMPAQSTQASELSLPEAPAAPEAAAMPAQPVQASGLPLAEAPAAPEAATMPAQSAQAGELPLPEAPAALEAAAVPVPTSQAPEPLLREALNALDIPAQPAQDAQGSKAQRHQKHNTLTAARSSMTGWKPVEQERLDDMRGGFDVGGLQVSFGIERAVYINGALVVATSINIPDVSRITTDQATKLAAALGPSIISSTQNSVNASLAGSPATAGIQLGNGGSASSAGASASANGGAGAPGSAGTAAANGASASSTGAAGSSMVVIGTPTGQVVTNGVMTVIQNGPGNAAAVGSMAGAPATVIQNTLNNQSIRSLMTIDASVNTLQAFRNQVASAALNNALLRAASMR
jgi:hypothetical protein